MSKPPVSSLLAPPSGLDPDGSVFGPELTSLAGTLEVAARYVGPSAAPKSRALAEGKLQPVPTAGISRDLRIARSLRLRRRAIHNEMADCLRQREEAYRFADGCLNEFDYLAESDKALRSALMQVELRLQRAGAYFLTDDQVAAVLNEIAEVGADPRRFCAYMGVDGIAKIPAHEFDEALAALDAKRRREAA